MPSSSSEDDSSLQKKHSKKESKNKEEKYSKTEKKKKDAEHEDTADRNHKSTDRKHTKKAKSKRKHRDRDNDSESPEPKKRNTLSPELKSESHNRPKKEKSTTSEETKRHYDRPEKVHHTGTGSPESGGRQKFPDRYHDDNGKRSPQASYKRSSRDVGDNRERFEKRNDARQFGPSDRSRDRAGTPPWKRRAEEERKDPKRPVWATSRVVEHAEQIQKRKLLWQRPAAPTTSADDGAAQSSKPPAPSTGTNNWTSMLAAAGSDEKSVDKFKRLMGIRDEGGATSSDAVEAERNRQQALYRDLDEQYNIARSVTHTGRGKGLGFASKYL